MVAIVTTIAGAVSLSISAVYLDGADQAIVTTVGTVLLSLGLVTLLQEAYLKESITRELLELVGLQQDLVSAGIKEIAFEQDIDWKAFLEDGETYRLLLIDPAVFADREWNHILSSGRDRRVAVSVFLPDASTDVVGAVAKRCGLDPNEFVQRLTRAERVLRDTWNNAAASTPPLTTGSLLEIRPYQAVPGYAIVAVDARAAVLVGGAVVPDSADRPLVLRFELDQGSPATPWLETQFSPLEDLTPTYAGRVE